MPVGRKEDPPFSPRVGQADRQDDGNSNGSPTSTVVLQEPTAAEVLTSGSYEAKVPLNQSVKEDGGHESSTSGTAGQSSPHPRT